MKLVNKLLTIDSHNYNDTNSVFEKHGVRALIIRNGKIAVQQGNAGDYKLPGGGIEPGEGHMDTLLREVREETGLVVIVNSVCELGEIEEIRQDIFQPDTKFICHTYYYLCQVTEEVLPLQLTQSEQEKGYRLAWATAEEICKANRQVLSESWALRDTAFLELAMEENLLFPLVSAQ